MQTKLIIIDAGGVLHPDSDLGGANQFRLHALTSWAPEKLDELQDHERLNQGDIALDTVFEQIIANTLSPKLTMTQLLDTYREGIALYPDAADMLRYLIAGGHRVVLLTNNSAVGVLHTKNLLQQEALSTITVYGSAEMKINKPHVDAFQYVCQQEKIKPENCLFIDDRVANLDVAKQLGMNTIEFRRPSNEVEDAKRSVAACMQRLVASGMCLKS